jgi:outer membrane protein OmpA-like peptidoglycan-associated protein
LKDILYLSPFNFLHLYLHHHETIQRCNGVKVRQANFIKNQLSTIKQTNMKFISILLAATVGSFTVFAQGTKADYNTDNLLSRWAIDVNLLGGLNMQNFTTENSIGNYLNAVNTNTGDLKFKDGAAYCADAQIGFFFGKKRHSGIGTGFMYMMQQGNAVLDNYHVEYQATDIRGNTFRQVITGNDDLNKATVHVSSYPVLDEAALELKENKGDSVTIDGHAGTTGREPLNRVLSLRRANAVKQQLVIRGINPKRLKTKGHGSSIPAADNTIV